MYAKIQERENEIFHTICKSKERVQDCSQPEINNIFGNNFPPLLFAVGESLENYDECTGVTDHIFKTYYFTKRR